MKRSFTLVDVLLVVAFLSDASWAVKGSSQCRQTRSGMIRPHSVSITEFGAVGDGVTLNTKAFQNAIFYLNSFADKGGARLFVPAGRWLTGSFDLISHLTLWLDKDAVILGSTNSVDWPVVDPLPSYGRGRIWWEWFQSGTLHYSRPHLVELINSTGVVISNLTFLNSPFWTIHPVYCSFYGLGGELRLFFWMNSHVRVQNVTILAPLDSPNTDGIDPDSSNDVCIEHCYISTGDDLIAIKSGWDEYGISYGRPSTRIFIRGLIGETQLGSGIAIGSEMSGGVSEVYAENLQFFNSVTAIRIKTSPGRGGYVRNMYISNVTLDHVDIAIRFMGQYGEHPDEFFDPNALPIIERITIKDVTGKNIKVAGLLEGIEGDNFLNICLSNITLNVISETPWKCSYIEGYSNLVTPETCDSLKESIFPKHYLDCFYLSRYLWSSSNQDKGARLWSW
uniref:Polygalacturonase n=1 Tax=Mangifera indica TaxID=29780 RepID=A0A514YDE8_MANIN|nr:polygalacturonase [Mangifera indica]